MATTVALGTLAALLLAVTLGSFLPVPHGSVRALSFPRLQILALTLALLAATLAFPGPPSAFWPILAAELVVIAVQALSILPFTPLWRRQARTHRGAAGDANVLSILSANVKMSNRDYARTLATAKEADADMAVFIETDQAWCDALMPLAARAPHVVAKPLDNAYGMILFSRLPLSDAKVETLVLEGVPSISATVTLRDGQRLRFHALHPEPPVPTYDSLGRDAELLKLGQRVAAEPLPSIVTGDLNDVAWSHTTRLFQRISRLLDPRVGRGFYNTFDARYPFLRWPLDHLFHDRRFAIAEMKRLPAGGSDHFPMFFRLALAPGPSPEPEAADAADRAEAAALIRDGDALGREAIGVDWEKR